MDKGLVDFYGLNCKNAIVTGASSGLGEQIAKSLSSVGMRVFACARNIERLKNLTEEFKGIIPIEIDVGDKSSVKKAFLEIENERGQLDVCVNAAGVMSLTPIFDEEENDNFENNIQVNLLGAWYMSRQVAIHMKKNNINGSIINISSI